MASSNGITRNPTIPLTKRDSLAMTGSRVSLISNNSNLSHCSASKDNNKNHKMILNRGHKQFDKESDFVNAHSEMVAGKKRTTEKVKRRDSYKFALDRQSTSGDIDKERNGDKPAVKHTRGCESRAKYNTLPINIGVIETQSQVDGKRKKHKSGRGNHVVTDPLHRSASQKSGTFPSPDTDEDQHSTQPDRKKKSRFRKVKERIFQTFKIDDSKDKSKHKSRTSHKPKPRHHTVSGGRVRTNSPVGSRGFETPISPDDNGDERGVAMEVDEDSSNKARRTLLQTIRKSFRRKKRPETYSKETVKPSTSKDHIRNRSQPIDIPKSDNQDQLTATGSIADEPSAADDTISEIFGSLINPTFSPANGPKPDRSKLKLEGLKKCRPRSFDRKCTPGSGGSRSSALRENGTRSHDLPSTVEIDGLDETDAPVGATGGFQEESDDGSVPYDIASPDEKQRRVDQVGRRLAAIGDNIVVAKESESATSSSEAGPRRLSAFEEELLRELQNFGDTKNSEMSKKGGVSIYLVPIVKKLITAHSYKDFKQIVQREMSNTMGWDQVAWYTYVTRMTLCAVGTGKDLGIMFRNNAERYFNSNIHPFIQSRPNGWESIYEETDVDDSELD